MTAHTILVAITVDGKDVVRQDAEEFLYSRLPKPAVHFPGDEAVVDSWWVAEDVRFDGSDCDSAVFVKQGNQEAAVALLRAHGLAY